MAAYQEVKISIHPEAEEAVTALFLAAGAGGVAVESSQLLEEAARERWGDYFPESLSDPNIVVICGYFPENWEQLDEFVSKVRQLSEFGLKIGNPQVTVSLICEEDWADSWKKHYHGESIGRVLVKPSWEDLPMDRQVVVNLDPGMAFGTGGHPTTRMCIEFLQQLDLKGKILWDVGTGSGILAITAAKLGAAAVQAVEIDRQAVTIAEENVNRNDVDVSVHWGSIDSLTGRADIILMNIIADVIIDLLPQCPAKLNPGGIVFAAGIIADRAKDVRRAAEQLGMQVTAELCDGEWRGLKIRLAGESKGEV